MKKIPGSQLINNSTSSSQVAQKHVRYFYQPINVYKNWANRNIFLAGLAVFSFFLFFYGITSRGGLQLSDEVTVFATGLSLATRGSLAIDQLQNLQNSLSIGQIGRDNHLYGKYFPGNVISVALVYKLAEKQNDQSYFIDGYEAAPSITGVTWAIKINAFYGAVALTALFFLLKRYFDWKTTIITVLLLGLCSDWWYQSRGFLSEVGAGAFLMVCLCFAAYKKPYLSSLALALSILFRPTNIIALPIWGYAFWRSGRKAIWSVLFVVAGLCALAFYNWIRFSSPFNFGYSSIERFGSSVLFGLYGILLSPGRSIFIYSPVLTLAIPGAWSFYKKEKILTIICTITILAYLVIIASWYSWEGGVSWGSRLLTPIVPILGFLVASTIEFALKNKRDMIVVGIFAILGFSVEIIALARDPIRVMNEQVFNGSIHYGWTLHTVQYSWLVLQIKSLQNWRLCDLDANPLRYFLGHCP